MTTPETWMPEARQIAAQCWCDDETKNTAMDTVLAEAVARRIAVWMDTAAEGQRNCDYYRSLVVRCGNALGVAARTCDDGCKSKDVLCAKVPELVESLRQENSRLREALEKIACWKHEQGDFLPWPVATARTALNPPKS